MPAHARTHLPLLRRAALGAATAVAFLSWGDLAVLAVLLGVTSLDVAALATALLVAAGVLARLGTTSLSALAGFQAVVGPAGVTAPAMAAASAWLGAAALVLASPGGWGALPFGLAAALVVEGPAATSPAAFVVRLLAMVALADCAAAAGRWLPRGPARWAALAAGLGSALTGLLATPPGALTLRHAVRLASIAEAVALVAAGTVVALLTPRVQGWWAARGRPAEVGPPTDVATP